MTKPTLPPALIPDNIEAMFSAGFTQPYLPTTGEEIALEYLGREIKRMGFERVALHIGHNGYEPCLRFEVYPFKKGWVTDSREIKIKSLEKITPYPFGMTEDAETRQNYYFAELSPVLIIEGVSLTSLDVPDLMRILRDIKNSNNLLPDNHE